MQRHRIQKALGALLLLPWLSGCLVHTRSVQQAKMPTGVKSATADELVQSINSHCQDIQSLSATVEFTATEGGAKKGKIKTFTSFGGYILLRKPEALRVIGLLPVVHTRAFDMATNGDDFKLWLPHYNKVIEGPNTVTKESPNALENFRPNVFSDSLLIHCIGPDELVTLTSDTENVPDPKTKELIVKPEYDLTVEKRKENSQELIAERVIHFDRLTLEPYQVDIYDSKGAIQTEAIYGPQQTFGKIQFPGTITIKRPLEELEILTTFQKVTTNLELKDSQFELQVPSGVTVQELH
ncbi:LolA family protein [Silvibacterium sp.]|uniref:LolA family protein n=1 Tax=Silvibacterium sp. TaxID=1964179 RepID=UPI0039E4FA3D